MLGGESRIGRHLGWVRGEVVDEDAAGPRKLFALVVLAVAHRRRSAAGYNDGDEHPGKSGTKHSHGKPPLENVSQAPAGRELSSRIARAHGKAGRRPAAEKETIQDRPPRHVVAIAHMALRQQARCSSHCTLLSTKMPSHSSVSAIAVAVIPATVSPVLPLLGGNVTSCSFDLPGWSRVCACGEDRGKDQRGGSQPAQQAAALQRMALVIHHRVSNNSGALFFTLLIARPSGRSCSTSLAGRIRAAASWGAARSQASMSSSSLYR